MSNTTIALVGFIAWTLVLLILMEAIRTYMVVTGKCRPTALCRATTIYRLSCSAWRGPTPIALKDFPCSAGYCRSR